MSDAPSAAHAPDAPETPVAPSTPLGAVKALVFDVFGTVVDWRGSVIREGEALGRRFGLTVDWPRFADEWRRVGYRDAIARVRRGDLPWMNADALHRRQLEAQLVGYGLAGLEATEVERFNRVWHRLDPWPDSVPGLIRLRHKFVVAPLSNGSFALLTNMAKHAALPWDCILSTELVRAYKPDPAAYAMAPALLDLAAHEVMLVAAHAGDLRAAQASGLRTGFVPRPLEHGPDGPREPAPDPSFDVVAADFEDLAARLGT
jgi:2-haloacid dehalogenase